MAKKDEIILKKLGELKPSVPTSTRAEPLPVPVVREDIVVRESQPGLVELVFENLRAMEEIRGTLFKEFEKMNDVFIEGWERTMAITYDIQKTNVSFVMDIIQRLIPPLPKK